MSIRYFVKGVTDRGVPKNLTSHHRTINLSCQDSKIANTAPLLLFKGLRNQQLTTSPLLLQAPSKVDFNVNGECNLRCPWCWGPDHAAKEELTNEQWKSLALKLKSLGTRKITFTGGEPLMKEGLADLLTYTHDTLSLQVTLSTNGVLLKRLAKSILPHVDAVGLPLDGHCREVHRLIRGAPTMHFDRVLEALRIVQQDFPHIRCTLRTVCSAKNMNSVPLIGEALTKNGVDVKKVRWKLYQVNPVGIRKQDILEGAWLISTTQFLDVTQKTRDKNPEFQEIISHAIDSKVGRYFHIYPDGRSHVLIEGSDGFLAERVVGNIERNFDAVMQSLSTYDFTNNRLR